jgi:hypothetical protein
MGIRALLAPIAMVVALALAACDAGTKLPVVRTWQLQLPPVDAAPALLVTVADETGAVKLAELAGDRMPMTDGFGGVELVDGDPTRLLVGWVGGMCDRSAEVRFVRDGASWVVRVTTDVAPGGCDAMGIGRAVILDLADGAAVDPAMVSVSST